MEESAYWRSYAILRNEVESALSSYYTEKSINDYAREHDAALRRMNASPDFWITIAHALQTTYMITLGRVFDHDPRSHSIFSLLRETVAHPEYFSKEALARRKRAIPGSEILLTEHIETAWEPGEAGLKFLWNTLKPSIENYDQAFAPIRNKLYAHQDVIATDRRAVLISMGLSVDFEKIMYDVYDVLAGIWELAYNGVEPKPGLTEYSYQERIMSGTRMTLEHLLGNETGAGR